MSGRIRTIKPELLEDERVGALSDGAFRLFIAAILSADDHGNFRAEPRQLRGLVYWGQEHVQSSTVAEFRNELLRCGLINGYRVRGQTYAHLSGWAKHQRVDNAGKNRMPLPNDSDAEAFHPNEFRAAPLLPPGPTPTQSSTSNHILTRRFADSRGDHTSSIESPPLAQSSGVTSDLRPPTSDPDQRPATQTALIPQTVTSSPPASSDAGRAQEVFDHWTMRQSAKSGIARSRLKYTTDRRTKILARLREGYSVEELKRSIDGMFATEFNIEKGFTDVELACRNAAHVDRYSATADASETQLRTSNPAAVAPIKPLPFLEYDDIPMGTDEPPSDSMLEAAEAMPAPPGSPIAFDDLNDLFDTKIARDAAAVGPRR